MARQAQLARQAGGCAPGSEQWEVTAACVHTQIPDDEAVALVELSRETPSPLALLSGGASAASFLQVLLLPEVSIWATEQD